MTRTTSNTEHKDTKHNDTQHNNTQRMNDTQHKWHSA